MKVQFIGTGSIKSFSNSASILINDHILFDVPNGNLKAMLRQGVDILKIDTIIISHTHADHYFDVPFVLWYKKNFGNNNDLQIKIITDEITMKNINSLIDISYFDSAKSFKIEFIDFKNVDKIKILDDLDIKSQAMEHIGIKYANGYVIKENNIRIGLTGDTSFCNGIKNIAKDVDILISDMTLEIGDESHMGINNVKELLNEYPNLKIIPVHMYDETRKKAKEVNNEKLTIVEDAHVLYI